MVMMGASQGQLRHGALPGHLHSRISECRQLRGEATTQEEKDAWLAEEIGLLDALLDVDRTVLQRQDFPFPFEHYARGLLDGRTIMRVFAYGGNNSPCRNDG